MTKSDLRCAAAVLAAAAFLAACGSNGDGPAASTSTTDVPASAQSSVSGLIDYINSLIAMTSETSEPVRLGDATLPTDDTALPSP